MRIPPPCDNCLDYTVRRYGGCVDVYKTCRPLHTRDRWVCDGPLGCNGVQCMQTIVRQGQCRPLHTRTDGSVIGPLGYNGVCVSCLAFSTLDDLNICISVWQEGMYTCMPTYVGMNMLE